MASIPTIWVITVNISGEGDDYRKPSDQQQTQNMAGIPASLLSVFWNKRRMEYILNPGELLRTGSESDPDHGWGRVGDDSPAVLSMSALAEISGQLTRIRVYCGYFPLKFLRLPRRGLGGGL